MNSLPVVLTIAATSNGQVKDRVWVSGNRVVNDKGDTLIFRGLNTSTHRPVISDESYGDAIINYTTEKRIS
jgi:hypothetical protein